MAALKVRKTYVAKPSEIRPAWHVLDATGKPLGRLATEVATLLQGKHLPIYTPTIMTGDFVIVVNAAKVEVTGKKMTQKQYHFHSGYPGGMRVVPLERLLEHNPRRVIEHAVHGMLPKSTLGARMLKRLKVYGGETHPHQAQVKGSGEPSGPHVRQGSPKAQGGKAS